MKRQLLKYHAYGQEEASYLPVSQIRSIEPLHEYHPQRANGCEAVVVSTGDRITFTVETAAELAEYIEGTLEK